MKRRALHFINREREWNLMQMLETLVDVRGCTSDNTAVVMVSPDYSATLAMHLAHAWSTNGECLDIITLDVPYPDESSSDYAKQMMLKIHEFQKYDRLILVEAGIIRGTNWEWILDVLVNTMNFNRSNITLVALCENQHARVSSDYVGEYYNDDTHELMFYFEKYNKHWPIK